MKLIPAIHQARHLCLPFTRPSTDREAVPDCTSQGVAALPPGVPAQLAGSWQFDPDQRVQAIS